MPNTKQPPKLTAPWLVLVGLLLAVVALAVHTYWQTVVCAREQEQLHRAIGVEIPPKPIAQPPPKLQPKTEPSKGNEVAENLLTKLLGAPGLQEQIQKQTKDNAAHRQARMLSLQQYATQLRELEPEIGNKLIEALRSSDTVNDLEAAGLWAIRNQTAPPWQK